LLPGNWLTVSYEMISSIFPCAIVFVLALMSCRRAIVENLGPINEMNNGVMSTISRPSLYINNSSTSSDGVLPNIEARTTIAIICLQIPIASLYLIGSIIKLIDLMFYNGDPLLKTMTLIVDSLICLAQPFLLCIVRSTLRSNLAECVEESRSIRTRTTASFRITHQQTDTDSVEQASAHVATPFMLINVKVSPSETDLIRDSRNSRSSETELSGISVRTCDGPESVEESNLPESTSAKETVISLLQTDKEIEDGLPSENSSSIANSEDSICVRIGSGRQHFARRSPGPTLDNFHTTDFLNEVKTKLKRSVSECYHDDLRLSFNPLEDVRFPTEVPSQKESLNKDVPVPNNDDQIKGVTKGGRSYLQQVDNVGNDIAIGLPEVEPQRILQNHVTSQSSSSSGPTADNAVSNCTRTSGIRIEVETEEILRSVWKKESDTGELISSRIISIGGASREVMSQQEQVVFGQRNSKGNGRAKDN